MIENTILFNINAIIGFAQNVLMFLGGFTLAGIIVFLVYSHKNTNIFIKQNDKLTDKFPLVAPEFFNKSSKEQNIENNQEIHEINKKIEELEKLVKGAIEKCK